MRCLHLLQTLPWSLTFMTKFGDSILSIKAYSLLNKQVFCKVSPFWFWMEFLSPPLPSGDFLLSGQKGTLVWNTAYCPGNKKNIFLNSKTCLLNTWLNRLRLTASSQKKMFFCLWEQNFITICEEIQNILASRDKKCGELMNFAWYQCCYLYAWEASRWLNWI